MDTSETYVKMCDCPEIQDEWQFRNGDFYIDLEIHGRNKYILNNNVPDFSESGYTWLPRQDQIQEMLKKIKTPDEYDEFLHRFYGFCFQGRYGDEWPWKLKEVSYEQLWLAFYMQKKHGKVWDGEKWTKK